MPKSDIPMGSEFGPNQIDLARVLELAQEHAGDEQAFVEAIVNAYGWESKTARNTPLSMKAYLLLSEDNQLTDTGQRLLSLQAQPDEMHAEFARHILFKLHGLEVVNAIDTLIRTGKKPTQLTIAEILKAQGLYVPESSTHISKLCGWLSRASIFRTERAFDSLDIDRASELIGANQADVDTLAEMPADQHAVLKALCNLPMEAIPDKQPLLGNKIMDYAEELYGVHFNSKNFPREVLEPLAAAGYLRIEKAAKATGEEAGSRTQVSGKPYLVYRTEKFSNEYLSPLVDALANTGLAVRQLLRKPLSEIVQELQSENTGIKGKALEALAFYFMRLLGLEFRGWRKRGKKTGGFEVDIIVEGARLVFSRWQIQCKNTPDNAVSLEDIAKEVGLSLQIKSNVILVITTGRFSKDALDYANDMMQMTNLNIITLDKRDLTALKTSSLSIVDILNRKARQVIELKALPDF
ncbi:MAG TPA: restriction endonuclease [Ktedonobacteraceae bacterium]|nr:restriction endonuclease [Ktedonobacteraceae bacterium]